MLTLTEINQKLTAAGLKSKLSRDGSNVVVSRGDKGFFRVLINSTHPYAVDGVHIADHSTYGRAAARFVMSDIRKALEGG